jgi:transketolase
MHTTLQGASLRAKCDEVRRRTLLIHRDAPETRIASSLSPVEILVALYYGGVMAYDPSNPAWPDRDRLIVSKGHGSVSFYPILADLGYFPAEELDRVCKAGGILGGIPDCVIPGYETTNGSLGHGPGVGCGMAIGLRAKGKAAHVFVLTGDGELYEGACWEAFMLAGAQGLGNLTVVVDANRAAMLDWTRNIIDLEPLGGKFTAFGWDVEEVDGHDVEALKGALLALKGRSTSRPAVLIARTLKGRGVPRLERDPLSHIRTLTPGEIDELLGGRA